MKIAVYTITKNEGQFVARWAKSCEDMHYSWEIRQKEWFDYLSNLQPKVTKRGSINWMQR